MCDCRPKFNGITGDALAVGGEKYTREHIDRVEREWVERGIIA